MKFYTNSLIKCLVGLEKEENTTSLLLNVVFKKNLKHEIFNIKDLFNSLGESSAQFQRCNLISFKLYFIFQKFCSKYNKFLLRIIYQIEFFHKTRKRIKLHSVKCDQLPPETFQVVGSIHHPKGMYELRCI